jgi:ribosomal protein S18 acetylase RimI-like enzyme
VETDLPNLKWLSVDWSSYYEEKWQQKLEDKLDMYVVTLKDFPIARSWLDWTKYAAEGIGNISSFEVLAPFRSLGIGSFMILNLEKIMLEKGLKIAQTGTLKTN